MKTVKEYIIERQIENLNEGLLSKLKGWFSKLYKTQENLVKDNKPISIKVDIKQIKGPESSCKLDDIIKNSSEMEVINNKQVGFPTTAMLIKQSKKYFTDEESQKEYTPEVNRFFYVDGKNTYYIGLSMFDTSIEKVEGYSNILNIDTLANVENLSEVQKFICEHLEETLKNKGNKGMLYDSKHPRIKAVLIKNGFTQSKENKNWLIKQIK